MPEPWQTPAIHFYKKYLAWTIGAVLVGEALLVIILPSPVLIIPTFLLVGMLIVALVNDALDDATWDQHELEFDRYHDLEMD